MDIPAFRFIQVDKHVAIVGWNTDISNHLINTYNAIYLNIPFDMYLIPNTSIEELQNDTNLVPSKPIPKKPPFLPRPPPKLKTAKPPTTSIKSKLPRASITPSTRRKEIFITGIKEIDSNVLLSIDSLEKIMDYYDQYQDVKEILHNPVFFEELRDRHELRYINIFDELLKLREELKMTKERNKIHYKHTVEDYRVGDRVIFRGKNYVILTAGNTEITMKEVNMFGDIKSDDIIRGILTHNRETGKFRKWFWHTEHISNYANLLFKEKISRGILLYNYGPLITSLDSIFLKYITLPANVREDSIKNVEPEVGMLVSVQDSDESRYSSFVYLIVYIYDDGRLKLKYIDELNKTVHMSAIPETWKIIIAEYIGDKEWNTDGLGKANLYMGDWYVGFDPPR